ncbi:Holliday junction DNA helicase RuvA [hydrothermal vent metagenome]|uniref:Holliday junction DNA helicase RuvA n=1 Tax=hydrothermal vent metagenome TaxID=652676 RepID=A0A1W1CDU7_9ZZZZ
MIVGIEGTIEKKDPTFIHLNVNGVIYEVNISVNTSQSITQNRVKLLVTQIIREDANLLFGFMEANEKKMFDTLIKINGVGPKVAMATCSTFAPTTFSRVVADKDVTLLKRVPGIGAKSASRILVELADFIVDSNADTSVDNGMSDAILALESLGFKKEHIQKALVGATGDVSALVKHGLKKLQRL